MSKPEQLSLWDYKPAQPKSNTLTVQLGEGRTMDVKVKRIVGQMAIHRSIDDPECWTLSHIASGLQIETFQAWIPSGHVESLALRLAAIDLDAYALNRDPAIAKQFGQIVKDWQAEIGFASKPVEDLEEEEVLQPDQYRYAVNVADMLGAEFPVKLLINPVISKQSEQVLAETSERMDGTAIVLGCDEARSKAIHSTLRLKIAKHRLRMYKQKIGTSTWQRI